MRCHAMRCNAMQRNAISILHAAQCNTIKYYTIQYNTTGWRCESSVDTPRYATHRRPLTLVRCTGMLYLVMLCNNRNEQSATAYKALGQLTSAMGHDYLSDAAPKLLELVLLGLTKPKGQGPWAQRYYIVQADVLIMSAIMTVTVAATEAKHVSSTIHYDSGKHHARDEMMISEYCGRTVRGTLAPPPL